jgi:hypothetical protein
MLEIEFPRFVLRVQEQGALSRAYLFLISVDTSVISDAVMVQLGAPRGAPLYDYPPEEAFIAAGLGVLATMRDLLVRGVDAVVEDQMFQEHRFRKSEVEEKVMMARQALATAKVIGAAGLEAAERHLQDRMRKLARRLRRWKPR